MGIDIIAKFFTVSIKNRSFSFLRREGGALLHPKISFKRYFLNISTQPILLVIQQTEVYAYQILKLRITPKTG